MPAEKRDEVLAIVEKHQIEVMDRTRTRISEEIPFSHLADTVHYPVFSKRFDRSELEQMLAYQESAVGRKAITTMPSNMQETALAFERLYGPKIREIGEAESDPETLKAIPASGPGRRIRAAAALRWYLERHHAWNTHVRRGSRN